ncbi:transposase [Brevibacillus laterosporus]|uniref:DUF6262 family protein n=1 Tax=Brevibacillus laterosporus TaxID=1465 RepID=UPI000CE4B15A|nr:DUF6262 family protein [Brevibacillus laterosporus]PPA87641.1 transposase [Brevibacillus laterosporus]
MKHKRNTTAVIAFANQKKEDTRQKVDFAIKKLIKQNRNINFNTVATTAGVSKSYLYNHTDFRERIESLRKQQLQVKSPKSVKRNMSDESKDALMEVLRERIKKLENENKRLKEENKRLNGKLYEQI